MKIVMLQELMDLKVIIQPKAQGQYIFSTTHGEKPLSGFSQIKSRLHKASGITDWTFHDFRRSMATALADAGVDEFAIKYSLNHKDSSVTGVYNRSQHLKRKTLALSKWYDLVSLSNTAKVHHLRKA